MDSCGRSASVRPFEAPAAGCLGCSPWGLESVRPVSDPSPAGCNTWCFFRRREQLLVSTQQVVFSCLDSQACCPPCLYRRDPEQEASSGSRVLGMRETVPTAIARRWNKLFQEYMPRFDSHMRRRQPEMRLRRSLWQPDRKADGYRGSRRPLLGETSWRYWRNSRNSLGDYSKSATGRGSTLGECCAMQIRSVHRPASVVQLQRVKDVSQNVQGMSLSREVAHLLTVIHCAKQLPMKAQRKSNRIRRLAAQIRIRN